MGSRRPESNALQCPKQDETARIGLAAGTRDDGKQIPGKCAETGTDKIFYLTGRGLRGRMRGPSVIPRG